MAEKRRTSGKGEKKCGYDCRLVTPPPDVLQTECPICLHILREPCVISCPCGQKMCRECVESIKEIGKPCPLCNKTNFSFMRDYGLERAMSELLVTCFYRGKGCKWRGKLGEYEEHLNEEPSSGNHLIGCKFLRIKCPLYYAGCSKKLLRKNMPAHVSDVSIHLPLLSAFTQNLMTENEELRRSFNDLRGENLELKKANEQLTSKFQKLEQDTSLLKKDSSNVLNQAGRMDFYVKYVSKNVKLPSFFSHSSHGYRMGVNVYPTGTGEAKDNHISIFTYLLRGRFDKYLKWPFRGVVKIQIVNQLGDHNHAECTITYKDVTPLSCAGRVTGKNEESSEWGLYQFLAHQDLGYNAEKQTQYLKDDVFIVRVVGVTVH